MEGDYGEIDKRNDELRMELRTQDEANDILTEKLLIAEKALEWRLIANFQFHRQYKNEDKVLLMLHGGEIVIGYRDNKRNRFQVEGRESEEIRAINWMPLPTKP